MGYLMYMLCHPIELPTQVYWEGDPSQQNMGHVLALSSMTWASLDSATADSAD